MCSSAIYVADTQPHSPFTLTYGSITHTRSIGGAHAIPREADHALNVRIAFFRFPFVNLAYIPSRLLIALCPMTL